MSTNLISSGTTAREKVNLRTPDVMAAVQEQVEQHYRSDIVDKVRRAGGIISAIRQRDTQHHREAQGPHGQAEYTLAAIRWPPLIAAKIGICFTACIFL